MKNQKKNKTSLIVAICMMAVAVALIVTAGIGGTRAALQYQSDYLRAHVEMFDIGVTLTEQGEPVAYRNYQHFTDAFGNRNSKGQWSMDQTDLLSSMVPENEDFQIGKTYDEVLAVSNSGTINEFVRATVYKYWVNEDGEKDPTLDPKLIDIEWDNLGSGWTVASENEECIVLYCNSLLHSGATTVPFTKSLTVYIDDTVKSDYTVEQEGNVLIYNYRYDGSTFQIQVEVDAVQEHNAQDAILSAWGIPAVVSGETLSVSSY